MEPEQGAFQPHPVATHFTSSGRKRKYVPTTQGPVYVRRALFLGSVEYVARRAPSHHSEAPSLFLTSSA